jgi:secondary thiamine-phosphate synthase enzyme
MSVQTFTLQFETRGNGHTLDITGEVAQTISRSELQNGIVTIFTPSSTSALTTIEFEDGAVSDLGRLFDEIAAQNREYQHNLRWHDGNGHSHVRAALLGPSLTVPFGNGKLLLGTWQQIVYIDFDNRARGRNLICQVMGE